jgi:hypothetical protein
MARMLRTRTEAPSVAAVASALWFLEIHQARAKIAAAIWSTFATLLTQGGQPPFRNSSTRLHEDASAAATLIGTAPTMPR